MSRELTITKIDFDYLCGQLAKTKAENAKLKTNLADISSKLVDAESGNRGQGEKMKNQEQLWEICMDILQEMYANATPPMDFRTEMKNGNLIKSGWFLKHRLGDEQHEAIREKHNKKNKLNKHEIRRMDMAMMDYSPTCKEKE